MELAVGQIVISRAGRDVTRAYMVLQVETGTDRVLLADGGRHPLEAPKRKNIRHIQPTASAVPPEERATNPQIHAALVAFVNAGPQQGG